ncbi:MAG TPA: hypothetical protein VM223_05830 [Planctomycetota bacterium]|nr:hypothetical protein [Planctomycetota bacterium]
MSINCSIGDCLGSAHARGLCDKHYRRWLAHGNPYVERRPRCQTCMEMYRVLTRPGKSTSDLLEKFADLYLLFETGSSYIIRDEDKDSRKLTPRFREDASE